MPGSPIRPICRPIVGPIVRSINSLVSGGASLPAGAIGVYYATDYQSTPRKLIPNAVSTVAVESNLLQYPRRLFNTGIGWQKGGVTTITDAAATFTPDGTGDASIMTTTASNSYLQWVPLTVPAGDYTMAIWVRSRSGGTQDFRMCVDFGGQVTKTAQTTWTRFTQTFTVTAASHQFLFVQTTAALTALDLEICDAKLYAGTSAGTEYALSGHMYLGSSHYDTRPSVTAGEVDFTSVGYGVMQHPANVTLTASTTAVVGNKTAVASSFQGIMSRIQSYLTFSAMHDNSKAPTFFQNGGNISTQGGGLWDFKDLGYHCLIYRFSGTQFDIFLDDMKIYSLTVSAASVTAKDFWSGIVNSESFSCGYKWNSIVLYNSALSDNDCATVRSVLATKATASALTVTPITRVYFAEGHSIPANATGYPYLFGPNSSPKVVGINNAVGGTTLASMTARAAALDAKLPTNRTGRKFILTVDIGTNDLYSYAGATDAIAAAAYATALAAYCDARRAAGWLVVGVPVLPRSDAGIGAPAVAAHNARRALLRTEQLTWVGTHYDAFADWGGDATMWPDAASNNVTYYNADKIHPILAGHTILETYVRTAINAL